MFLKQSVYSVGIRIVYMYVFVGDQEEGSECLLYKDPYCTILITGFARNNRIQTQHLQKH